MKQISSIDLFYLISEFKILENSRIDSFYYDNSTFYIKIYVKGKGNVFLVNKVSKYVYLDYKKDESSNMPSNFVTYLRKYLRNSYIINIEQMGMERIIRLSLSKREEEKELVYYIYLELFSNGNVILCDSNNEIKNSLIKKKFKDRSIVVKSVYELPPKRKFDVNNFDSKLLFEDLISSDLEIVKFIANNFGTGGKFAEEICFRAEVEKNLISSKITKKSFEKLVTEIKNIVNHKINANYSLKGEEIWDFFPFIFKSTDLEIKIESSFNDLIRTYYSNFTEEVDNKEKAFGNALKKLKNRLEILEEQKNSINLEYEILNGYGNKIYENYSFIEDLLKTINKAAKEKGWNHVKEVIKNDSKLKLIVANINEKNNEIELNFN